jgi:hypothetical protein
MACAFLILAGLLVGMDQQRVSAEGPNVLLGASARPRGDETPRDAVAHLEQAIGRELALIRVYKSWNEAFPTDHDRWLRDSGHTLVLSVAPRWLDGSPIPWRTIANAAPGSSLYQDIQDWADRIKAFGATVYFSFHHEPEDENLQVMGTPADFADAWRKVVTVFRDEGVTNTRFVWILTAYTFARTDARQASAWYPGDEYVDAIGADGYNFFGCRDGVATSWRSFAQIFEPVRQFGLLHPSEPLMIAEFGSVEDPAEPGRKAQWITDAQATLRLPEWSQFRTVLYWHSQSRTTPPCRFWLDTSDSALAAFTALASDPYFLGIGPPVISSFEPLFGTSGMQVTVTGANFSAVQNVTFNGVPAAFSVANLSQLTAVVPDGATAGPISVTTEAGTGTSPGFFGTLHVREVSLALSHNLMARGSVVSEQGFAACSAGALVKILFRTRAKGWRTKARAITRADGSYSTPVVDRSGRYRARVPRSTLPSGDVCGRARSRAQRNTD